MGPEVGDRDDDRLIVALLAGVALALGTVATWRGVGLTKDSVQYLSTGVNIASSHGLVMLADQPLTIFPPGLPLIAGLAELVGIEGTAALRVVSIGSFVAMVVLGHRLLARVVPHRGVVLAATALIAVSPALLSVTKMAWSEPPFIVVCLLFLLSLGRVWDGATLTTRDIVVLAAWCWAAFALRYVGLSLVAVAGLALLLSVRPLTIRALVRIACFGALAVAGPAAWMLRNHAVDGTYTGVRLTSQDTIREVGSRTVGTFGRWVVPSAGWGDAALATVGLIGVALAVVGLVVALRSPRSDPPGEPTSRSLGRAQLLACTTFVGGYVAYLSVAALYTSFEPTNTRYLSPVLVPGVVIVAAGAAALVRALPNLAARRALGALATVVVVLQLWVSVGDARDGAADGIGYNARPYIESPLADEAVRIIDGADDAVVFSNQPFGLWAATRLQPIRWGPRSTGFRGSALEGELEAFVQQVACAEGTVYLVQYSFGEPVAMPLRQIRAAVDVERVATTPVGGVFLLTTDAPVSCDGVADARPTSVR